MKRVQRNNSFHFKKVNYYLCNTINKKNKLGIQNAIIHRYSKY